MLRPGWVQVQAQVQVQVQVVVTFYKQSSHKQSGLARSASPKQRRRLGLGEVSKRSEAMQRCPLQARKILTIYRSFEGGRLQLAARGAALQRKAPLFGRGPPSATRAGAMPSGWRERRANAERSPLYSSPSTPFALCREWFLRRRKAASDFFFETLLTLSNLAGCPGRG